MSSTLQPTRMDRLKTAKTKLYSVNPAATQTTGTALNTRQMLGIDPPTRGTYLLTVVITAAVSFAAGYHYVAVKLKKDTSTETVTSSSEDAVSSLALQRETRGESIESSSDYKSNATSDNLKPKLTMSLSVKEEPLSPKLALKAGKFAVDSAELTPATQSLLNNWAERLKKSPSMRIKISGHADDRGSLRYNDSLAQDRANVARRYLLAKGAKNSQIETTSFGKRRPLIVGNEENAWAQNRRIDLVEIKKLNKKNSQNFASSKNSVKSESKPATKSKKTTNNQKS